MIRRSLSVALLASALVAGTVGVLLVACGGSDDDSAQAATDAGRVDGGTLDATSLDGAPGTSADAADAAGDTGTTADAGATDSSAGDAAAAPITATADAWTWVDFPGSKCGSGTATGIGVNPHASATELMIFMQGGGDCTTGATCWGADPTASNMAGYDAASFAADRGVAGFPVLDRSESGNPFAAMNLAYIPYCTGDLHGGAGVANLALGDGGTRETYFYGGYDMNLFLERLVPTFPAMKRVYLMGDSAGGFGSFVSFDRVARAFGLTVYILDDSGPPIPVAGTDGGGQHGGDFGVWQYPLPPSCPTCGSLRDLYNNARAQQPASRYGLLTFNQDSVIAPDFGYTPAEYPQVITNFATSIASDPNAHLYEVDVTTPDHVVESVPSLAADYLPWMTQLVTDDATWKSQEISE